MRRRVSQSSAAPNYTRKCSSAPIDQGVGDRTEVDVFELTADRNTARQPRHPQPARLQRFGQHVCRIVPDKAEAVGAIAVDELDREALRLKRPVNRALAAAILRRRAP